MSFNKRNKNTWVTVNKKRNGSKKYNQKTKEYVHKVKEHTHKTKVSNDSEEPDVTINLQEELQDKNICYFCLRNSCRNDFHLREPDEHQLMCNDIFGRIINNPGRLSRKLNSILYKGIVEYMTDLGIKNSRNIFITSCSACLLSNNCKNVDSGFCFTLNIGGVDYTLCYKDPKTCRNKIPVCLHANFIYDKKELSIAQPVSRSERFRLEKEKLHLAKLKSMELNSENFPSLSKESTKGSSNKSSTIWSKLVQKPKKSISFNLESMKDRKINKKSFGIILGTVKNNEPEIVPDDIEEVTTEANVVEPTVAVEPVMNTEVDNKHSFESKEELMNLKNKISELEKMNAELKERNSFIFDLYMSSKVASIMMKKNIPQDEKYEIFDSDYYSREYDNIIDDMNASKNTLFKVWSSNNNLIVSS